MVRNLASFSFFTAFRRQEQKMLKQIDTLGATLKSDEEGPPLIPKHGTLPAPESLSQF